ncbi:hypothetical protein [Actinomadura sp. 3N407]
MAVLAVDVPTRGVDVGALAGGRLTEPEPGLAMNAGFADPLSR